MQPEIAKSLLDTIGEALARATARNPEKTAPTFGDRSWTYVELDAAANRTTNALLGLGLR
jgi:fatty-acyl-CoA synthase